MAAGYVHIGKIREGRGERRVPPLFSAGRFSSLAPRMPPELKVAPLTVSTLALWAERMRLMMPLPSGQ